MYVDVLRDDVEYDTDDDFAYVCCLLEYKRFIANNMCKFVVVVVEGTEIDYLNMLFVSQISFCCATITVKNCSLHAYVQFPVWTPLSQYSDKLI